MAYVLTLHSLRIGYKQDRVSWTWVVVMALCSIIYKSRNNALVMVWKLMTPAYRVVSIVVSQ
jgi:hypothetical protein